MTPEELQKTAAFLLDKITQKSTSANEIINRYTESHRYIAADDRKELLNLIWSALRRYAALTYLYPQADWSERLAKLADGMTDVSEAPDWVKWEAPEWIISHVPQPDVELPAQNATAPICLRSYGRVDEVLEALRQEGLVVRKADQSPFGIILEKHAQLMQTKPYKKGLVEVQDEGAQLVSMEIGVKPKDDVFDFCAGAGGKSLIMAQLMQNKGFILAYDASPKRLTELIKRARRSNISIIKTVPRLPEPFKKFDHVVVDAPCSGTGTWRRNPDMKWKLTPHQLEQLVKKQADILNAAEQYVKPGHYLTYITCSITTDENENQVETFLKTHPKYHIVRQRRYSPWRTHTDGFFVCVMQKN